MHQVLSSKRSGEGDEVRWSPVFSRVEGPKSGRFRRGEALLSDSGRDLKTWHKHAEINNNAWVGRSEPSWVARTEPS